MKSKLIFVTYYFLLACFLLLMMGPRAHSFEALDESPFKQTVKGRWSYFRPYVPAKKEYNFEIGGMWEENNQYWVGGNIGFHIGRCIFSKSQTCQQYADLIGGAGGREGLTLGLALSSVRWQFTDLTDNYAVHGRVMAGVMNQRDEFRDRNLFAYGIGYGITTSVHERLDLKLEARIGKADRIWGQIMVGLSFKLDQWVDYFAQKLEGMGVAGKVIKGAGSFTGKVIEGTVETTGKVLKGTVETTGNVTGKVVEGTGTVVKGTGKVIKGTGDVIKMRVLKGNKKMGEGAPSSEEVGQGGANSSESQELKSADSQEAKIVKKKVKRKKKIKKKRKKRKKKKKVRKAVEGESEDGKLGD